MKTKFLWIEDNATTDLKHLLGPVYMNGRYDPVIALTVAEGLYRMRQTQFPAVIVDIRLLPGDDPRWQKLYTDLGGDKGTALLGLNLIYSLFGPRLDDVQLDRAKENLEWVAAERFGVLTVEPRAGSVGEALDSFGINIYEQKTARTPNTVLLKMVERITGRPGAGGAHG
jgi:hypothetical protein